MKIFMIKNALIFAAMEHRGDFKVYDEDILRAIRLAQITIPPSSRGFSRTSQVQNTKKSVTASSRFSLKEPKMSAKQVQNQMRWADIREIDMALDLMLKMEILGSQKSKKDIPLFCDKKP